MGYTHVPAPEVLHPRAGHPLRFPGRLDHPRRGLHPRRRDFPGGHFVCPTVLGPPRHGHPVQGGPPHEQLPPRHAAPVVGSPDLRCDHHGRDHGHESHRHGHGRLALVAPQHRHHRADPAPVRLPDPGHESAARRRGGQGQGPGGVMSRRRRLAGGGRRRKVSRSPAPSFIFQIWKLEEVKKLSYIMRVFLFYI